MSLEFPNEEVQALENQVRAGGVAKEFVASAAWPWFESVILGALHDEAVETLASAKTDADRLKAQMMLLGARKPGFMLNRLIGQADAAQVVLREISNPEKEGENNA